MHQPKASGKLSPYTENSPNARRSIAENIRGHKVIAVTGWRVVATVFILITYASSGTGKASCHKNHSAATAADYHITVGWNAVAKQLQSSN